MNAIKTGGDFIDSYNQVIAPDTAASPAKWTDATLQDAINASVPYTERIDPDREIFAVQDGLFKDEPELGKELTDFLIENQLAFPIIPTNKKPKEEDIPIFLLIPIQLPGFDSKPIGWDRRWMIATMKIVDEYWDMIYGENRQVILSDLLYLISARAKELFNYDIDVVQMTILALLLTDQRTASRRARSILPYADGKKTPLRSLKTLVREATIERGLEPTDSEKQMSALIIEMAKLKQNEKLSDDKEKQNAREALNKISSVLRLIEISLDDVISQNSDNGAEIEIDGNKKARKDHMVDFKNKLEKISTDILEAVNKDDLKLFEETENLEVNLWSLKKLSQEYNALPGVNDLTGQVYEALMTDEDLFKIGPDNIKEIAKSFNIETEEDDGSGGKTDRPIDELKLEIQLQRKATTRRLLRNPSSKVGHVTAEVVLGVNFLKDLLAVGRDLVGGRSKTIEKKVEQAQQLLMEELRKKAESIGGNTLKDIRIEPSSHTVKATQSLFYLVAQRFGMKPEQRKVKLKQNLIPQPISPTYGRARPHRGSSGTC